MSASLEQTQRMSSSTNVGDLKKSQERQENMVYNPWCALEKLSLLLPEEAEGLAT